MRMLTVRPVWRLLCGSFAFSLSACSLLRTPPPVPPPVPLHWATAASSTDSSSTNSSATIHSSTQGISDFWASLGDAGLPAQLTQALNYNDDLKLGALRVRLARLQSSLTGLSRWPSSALGFNAGVSRPLSDSDGYPPTTSRFAGGNFSLSYPLDIWGADSAGRESADLDARASESDWRAARLAICVSVAQSRWQLGYLNQLHANALADLDDARNTLQLTQSRLRSGAISAADAIFARRLVADQQAALSQLERQISETRHAFALLMGQLPQTPQPELNTLPDTELPVPDTGLPAELLSRRADVHAAELRLRGSLARADATRLSFYPSLTLTASYGTASPTLGHFLANPVGQLASALALPLVQFNTARLSSQSARALYELEAVNFRKTLYQALRETEDALVARQRLAEQQGFLRETLNLSREAERLTLARWQRGSTDIQPFLDAKRARRLATLNLLQNGLQRRNNAVQLYAALGGNYQRDD